MNESFEMTYFDYLSEFIHGSFRLALESVCHRTLIHENLPHSILAFFTFIL